MAAAAVTTTTISRLLSLLGCIYFLFFIFAFSCIYIYIYILFSQLRNNAFFFHPTYLIFFSTPKAQKQALMLVKSHLLYAPPSISLCLHYFLVGKLNRHKHQLHGQVIKLIEDFGIATISYAWLSIFILFFSTHFFFFLSNFFVVISSRSTQHS